MRRLLPFNIRLRSLFIGSPCFQSRWVSTCPTSSSILSDSAPASPPLDFPVSMEFSTAAYERPRIKKVLLIEKLTRYEQYLYSQNVREDSFKQEVQSRFPGMYKTYQMHSASIQRIVHTLKTEFGVDARVRKAFHVSPEDADDVDAVIAAGGDGTFLGAASIILKPIPLFGINTDPARSEGRLLLNHFVEEDIACVVRRIMEGEYMPIIRQRIKVSILEDGPNGKEVVKRVIPHRPLNDVMVAELEAAPTLYAEVGVEDKIPERHKSSGVLVCTGTGSTAWNYNMSKVREDVVEGILTSFLAEQPPEILAMMKPISQRKVRDETNKNLLFDPRCKTLRYTVREPIENRVFTVRRPSGFAKKVRVRPLSSANTFVFLDGIGQVALPASATVVFEIAEDEPLYTAVPVDRDGVSHADRPVLRLSSNAATEETRAAVEALGHMRRSGEGGDLEEEGSVKVMRVIDQDRLSGRGTTNA